MRVTPNLRPEVGHHLPTLTRFEGDGAQVHMIGSLSYRNGGLVEFDECLTEDEKGELVRLLDGVATRVHAQLLDNNERRRSTRRALSWN